MINPIGATTTFLRTTTTFNNPFTWTYLTSSISQLAESVYDQGIKMLSNTKRSTRHTLRYHRPRRQGVWMQSKRKSKSRLAYRRRPRNAFMCIMMAMASAQHAHAYQSYTSEVSNLNSNVISMISKHNISIKGERSNHINARFDTDSYILGFDCHATTCMTSDESRMINTRVWKGGNLKGVGETRIEKIGTLVYELEDNSGKKTTHYVPDSLFVPNLSKDLLSPQHFAKHCTTTDTEATVLVTGAHGSNFHYGKDAELHLTIPHSTRTNVPELRISTGCKAFHSFALHIESKSNIQKYEAYCSPCAMPSTLNTNPHDSQVIPAVVSDDESDSEPEPTERTAVHNKPPSTEPSDEYSIARTDENLHDFVEASTNIQPPPQSDESEVFASSDKGELLRLHYKFGHMSFKRLKLLAAAGIIPKKLQNVPSPCCAACMFGKMARRPWRSKGQRSKIFQATAPGQCVSVDQMQSTTPGFIAQLKGRITKRRYQYATVFVDHFSGYSFVYLTESITSEATVKAKRAFEAHAHTLGVRIQHYHCDNGRFADNLFLQATRDEGQTITFCGVNAHFQNGRAEKKIRDLREASRTQLLHAINRWPGVCSINLWGYSFRYANDVHNNMPIKADGTTPLQSFTGIFIQSNPKDFHAFGCPVYTLDSRLAGGNSISHWDARCRVGLNLGFSPRHARTVSLVLNIHTSTVSPQFHIKHDDFFESVSVGAGNMPFQSLWQSIAGFRKGAKQPQVKFSDIDQPSTSLPPREKSINHTSSEPAADSIPDSITDSITDTDRAEKEVMQRSPSFEPPSEDPTGDDSTTSVRRSGRTRKATTKYKESVEMGLIQGFPAVNDEYDEEY